MNNNKSKKILSLIAGSNIHIAPNTKVIASEEFSSLLDAQETLAKVKADAAKYRQEVAKECELLKEQAEKEGFEQGFQKWAEHIAKLEAEIIQVRKDVEKMIFPVALKAAKKIVEGRSKLRKILLWISFPIPSRQFPRIKKSPFMLTVKIWKS